MEKIVNYDTLVLSGGGVKGFFLLGAIQSMKDRNLINNVNNYVGTSIGAIICYLLAIGYTPIELIASISTNRWMERIQHFNVVAMINGNGCTSFTPLYEALEKLTLEKIGQLLTLSKLRELYGKTLICCSYNMTTCKSEYIGPDNYPDLPCLTALRMTANIPLVFDRFKYMDNFYIDGGICDNFPIKEGMRIGNKVLGIFLNINEKSLQDEPEDGIMAYVFKLLQIPIIQSSIKNLDSVEDKVVILKLNSRDNRTFHDFNVPSKTRLDMFSDGYSQTTNFFNI
jgi:predicted acylesterase/phospholipase RssA